MLKNILLIGGSGTLGSAILNSKYFSQYTVLSPPRKILDITEPIAVKDFFDKNEIDFVIDSSGLARMKKCSTFLGLCQPKQVWLHSFQQHLL